MSDSDIITRCPQCHTAFRVTHNQLAVADGVVRCGSCLAVFKAVDNQTEQNKETSTTDQGVESKDDNFITDEEETGLELDDDIYDLDTDNKNKKTSLFDRKLNPISQHARESADESWALDILADLEDDEIEPIQIKRRSKPETEAKVETPLKQTETSSPREDKQAPAQESISLSPPHTPTKKRGFSFFRKRDKAEADNTSSAQDTIDDDILNFQFEESSAPNPIENELKPENTSQEDLDNAFVDLEPQLSDKQQAPDSSTEKKRVNNDIDDIEELYFDQDDYHEPSAFDDQRSRPVKAPTIAHEGFSSDEHTPISEEAIEDAMQSRTSYANERRGYLSGIQPAPVEMEWYGSERTQRWLWFIGALILALLLTLQIATFRFDELSKNPAYRPYYQKACELIDCQLPELIATEKIRTTNLVVRSHPSVDQALIIDAILVNNAAFSQPYPALRLEFSDLNNQALASRDLQPNEYLRGELAGATSMPSQQPIQLSLAINDPGESAVNYQLKVISAKAQP